MGTLYRRGGRTSNWQAEYTLHNGRRRQRSTGTSDKKTAAQILANWEVEEARRAKGLIDPVAERVQQQSARPIAEHRDEWIQSLRAAGGAVVHVDRQEKRLETIIAFCGWQSAGHITSESLERYISHLQNLGRSNQTIAHHAQVAKQFARWLARTNRIPRNPLDIIQKPSPGDDRRRRRRMLLPAEWPWLRDAAGDRATLYEFAIETGLRASEIRSLTASTLKVDGDQSCVVVQSSATKDGKPARQYITADLAKRLRRRSQPGPLFPDLPSTFDMADMIRDDLAASRSQWEDRDSKTDDDAENDFLQATNHDGESLDFHSLRHTCGAWLAIQGVHPKTIQTVMRHKTITLTMDTYGHLFPDSEPGAIAKIGQLLRP